jgi:hypothetical protein
MTTSSSYDWEMTRDQIITDAYAACGAIDENDTPTTAQLTKGARVLNGIIKTMSGPVGMPLWAITTKSFPLTTNTATYTIGIGQTIDSPKPIKIIQAWHRDTTTNFDTPVNIVSLDTYNRLGNKFVDATPVQLAYDPLISTGIIYIYPEPDSYSVSNREIWIRYQRPFQDFDASSDTPDFPTEWDLPLVYSLAVALAPSLGVPPNDMAKLEGLAKTYIESAQEAGYENASIFIQPATKFRE